VKTVKNHKVNQFLKLLSLMIAKRCSNNKHFMATVSDKVCKHYLISLIKRFLPCECM